MSLVSALGGLFEWIRYLHPYSGFPPEYQLEDTKILPTTWILSTVLCKTPWDTCTNNHYYTPISLWVLKDMHGSTPIFKVNVLPYLPITIHPCWSHIPLSYNGYKFLGAGSLVYTTPQKSQEFRTKLYKQCNCLGGGMKQISDHM